MEGQLSLEEPPGRPQLPSETYVHIATFLPVRKWRHVFSFLRMARRVQKQVGRSEGIIAYQVKAGFRRKHFWTYSIWADRRFVNAFVRTEPHATAAKRFDDWAGEGAAFVEWNSNDRAVDWGEAMKRLQSPSFYYRLTEKKPQGPEK